MGITYKVRIEDMVDAYESLDEDDAEELRSLINQDDEWLDLDKSGREIGELLEALGFQLDCLDVPRVKKLAKALEPISPAKLAEYLPHADPDHLTPYYEAFRALVMLAAKVGQGMEMEAS